MQIKIERTKEQILAKASKILEKWAKKYPQGNVPWIPRQSNQELILCINPLLQQYWDMYSGAISLTILRTKKNKN